MSSFAKLQKSFQDYFRIPIYLKGLGLINSQTLNKICITLNQIYGFSINQINSNNVQNNFPQFTKFKKTNLYVKLKKELEQRNIDQNQKLYFIAQDFNNQWPQFEIVYKISFVILVYENQQLNNNNSSLTNNKITQKQKQLSLNERIQKIRLKLKDKDIHLLGIIFLNDTPQLQKSLGLKYTILPLSLPLEQLSIFLQPWLSDLIPIIQQFILLHIIQCREQDNTVIVFNRSQEKSQPKIMKKKKKFRCIKLCGDLALMIHLYKYAYECYQESEEQLKKVDDYLWVLGSIQGKLACMTCNAQYFLNMDKIYQKIQDLIQQSFIFSKKIKYYIFEIQNFFKIIKLFIQDKEKFDEMIQNFLLTLKGLTQQQKFILYCYLGSLYEKADMQRKRNSYYFKAHLITQNYKPQLSELLLKTIISSKYLKKWQYLYAQTLQKIIQQQKYFNKHGQLHLQLIQNCSNVLSQKQIKQTLNYLNFSNYESNVLTNYQLIQIKQFKIQESLIKPKVNRLIYDQSPKKSSNGIFLGWKKQQNWLYEQNQQICFKGTIINKLPFQLFIKVNLQIENYPQKIPQFRLILPPNSPYKFEKKISFSMSEQLIVIKQLNITIFNFIIYKSIEPNISFQLYQKQPIFQLQIQNGYKYINQQGKQKIMIQFQQSSIFNINCLLKKQNKIQYQKIRLTCSIYYNIDVGFQQNQYNLSIENSFYNINLNYDNKRPNIKFIQSQDKQSSLQYNQKQKQVLCRLKKFKTSRNHIKRIQISLDYIKYIDSKYQINKQYSIQTKIINSIWGQIIQISTPGLQNAINKMINNKNQSEIQKLKINWNLIQQFYLVKIRFYKDKFNLKPFKIQYIDLLQSQDNPNNPQIKQVILSNLTEGQMTIKLKKYQMQLKDKKQLIQQSKLQSQHNLEILKPIKFNWFNIVNKKLFGQFNLIQKIHPLIFRPKINLTVQIQKLNNQSNAEKFQLIYQISGQINSHQIKLKTFEQNQQQSNISILIKGKTKINKIIHNNQSSNNNDLFKNKLQLKIIQQKSNKNKKLEEIILILEFQDKDIGVLQKIIKLK